MTHIGDAVTSERLEEILAGCEGVQGGPWELDKFACYVLAPSEKGGEFPLMDELGENGKVAEMRGWGYYTGKGHGALGLDPDEGQRRQRLTGEHVARLDPATVRAMATLALEALSRRHPSTDGGAVKVKPLDWHGPDVNGDRYAKSIFGTYTIRKQQGSMGFWLTQVGGYHPTVAAAQAAAQSDHDKRIQSALSLQPVTADGAKPKCHVQEYGKSDGTKDYYVAVTVEDRTITPHMHRIRGRAEYEVAEWEWLLNGGPKPDFDQFDLDALPTAPGATS